VAGAFIRNFLLFLVLALWVLILARVLLSWVDPGGRGRVAAFVIQMTEPILAPVRKALPRTGMFDLSPMIVLIVLGVLLRTLS
jgi:YggT family protein